MTQRELELVKVQRTLTRLKHSLAADRELNEQLPALVERHRKAVGEGKLIQISEVSLTEEDLAQD